MTRPVLSRRTATFAARAGAVGSAVMLALTLFALSPGEAVPAGAAGTQVGVATVINEANTGLPGAGQPITSGNSETPFSLFLGTNPTCPGDSADGGYNVTSFMVPSGTDLAGLQFDPIEGPMPTSYGTYATFRQPLYQVAGGSPYTGAQTAAASPAPGPGPIINIPSFNFAPAGVAPGTFPAGDYKIGIACVNGVPSDTQLSNFWAADITIATAASGGGAAGITWSVPDGGSTTTTTGTGSSTSTTSSSGSTSTTASGGSTSTTVAGGSTSTTASGGSTTSTSAQGSGGTSGGTAGGVSGSGGSLPTTGSSPAALVMWGFFLVVCGRMAIVLSRPPKVKLPRP